MVKHQNYTNFQTQKSTSQIQQSMSPANQDDLYEAVRIIHNPEEVVEIRILEALTGGRRKSVYRNIVGGFFDDMELLVREAASWSGRAAAICMSFNQLNPHLLARYSNRVQEGAPKLTKDEDILSRRYMLVDFDPIRPGGISATEAEHEAAIARARECNRWLHESFGFPAPIVADSGNGSHLLYRISLENDPASSALVQKCLCALAIYFEDDVVAVDQTTYNASRVVKFYGTAACKGDSTLDRPHRLSKALEAPVSMDVVPREKLIELAELAPEIPSSQGLKSGKHSSANTPGRF